MGEPEKRIEDLFALARRRIRHSLPPTKLTQFMGLGPDSNKILAQVKAELSEIKPDEGIVSNSCVEQGESKLIKLQRDQVPEPECILRASAISTNREWNEVVEIHLRKFRRFLHEEIDAAKITRLFQNAENLEPEGCG